MKNRMVNTRIWSDTWFSELSIEEKLIFLCLLTNGRTNICGIYEISVSSISGETGIEEDIVLNSLKKIERDGKISYKNGWVLITNFLKYQALNPKVIAGISYELEKVPVYMSEKLNWSHGIVKRPYKPQVTKKQREDTLKKCNFMCTFCKAKDGESGVPLEVDHILPISLGGRNDYDNLRILCQQCNGKRNAFLRWSTSGWTMDRLPTELDPTYPIMGSHMGYGPTPSKNSLPMEMGSLSEILKDDLYKTYSMWMSKMGKTSDSLPTKMGSLSHPNLNSNINLKTAHRNELGNASGAPEEKTAEETPDGEASREEPPIGDGGETTPGSAAPLQKKNLDALSIEQATNEVMKIFYEYNPAINFGNKTMRKDAEFIVNKFGIERALQACALAIQVQGMPYAPRITNPSQMKTKLGDLKSFVAQERAKKESKPPGMFVV